MKKQLLDLANDLENNGRFADADLIKEAILKKASFTCNGFCGEYECKDNQNNCKRLKKASEK